MAESRPQVRVRKAGQHALLNPETGLHVAPRVDEYFDQDHPLVKAHPWAFGTDLELSEEAAADRARQAVVLSGGVEAATAAPGEKRSTRRQSE